MAGTAGLDQSSEGFFSPAFAPAEIIQQGDSVWIGTGCNDVCNRLDDRSGCHLVGIELAETIPNPCTQHDAPIAAQHAPHNRAVGRASAWAYERLHNAAALHLVIVLPNDPFLAGNIWSSQHVQKARFNAASRMLWRWLQPDERLFGRLCET